MLNKAINNPNATDCTYRNHFAWKKEVPFSPAQTATTDSTTGQELHKYTPREEPDAEGDW
jgi:hypothetical protein